MSQRSHLELILTYSLRQIEEIIVLQVKVGDLSAISNLFRKVLQLVVGYIQRNQVTEFTYNTRQQSQCKWTLLGVEKFPVMDFMQWRSGRKKK